MAKRSRKIIIQLGVFLCLGLLSGCSGGDKWVFPFETAMVEYDVSGDITGRERLYIKDDMEARESVTVTVFDGEVYPTKSKIITRDGQQYYFYEGLKAEGSNEYKHYKIMKDMNFEDRKDYYLREVLLQGAVFNRIGKDKVLDRECDIYKVSFGEVCVWNNLILRQETDLMETKTTMIAREIKIDNFVDQKIFDVE